MHFIISAKLSVSFNFIVSFAYVFVSPLPTSEFTLNFLFNTCTSPTLFTCFIKSTFSLADIIIFASTIALKFTFLPFKTLQSILLTFKSKFKSIPSCASDILKLCENSKLVFRLLMYPSSVSAKYIIYVSIFPSILTFPLDISFL